MTDQNIISTIAAVLLLVPQQAASASDTLSAALGAGAERLEADAIAERFTGRTGTWVSADGSKKIEIFYGADNLLVARPIGGGGQMTGFYGITDTNRICISWDGGGNRLRCLDVVTREGRIAKYNADGSLNGTYAAFHDGRSF